MLGEQVLAAIAENQRFKTPDLKVADIAAAIGAPDYKVSQCIASALGFRNFNHLINTYRIEYAKEALTDANNDDKPILSIAFECGFNSIGPFNRAFRQEVGMTPRDFRASKMMNAATHL
ncbi:MAG: helix-turn-helix domain-containing protein [Pseudomonadota bacterium]